MRIELSRERNNIFTVPESFIRKNVIRIMLVYENDTTIDPSEYSFIGPRSVKINREVSPNSKIYGKIMEVKSGNKIVGRK